LVADYWHFRRAPTLSPPGREIKGRGCWFGLIAGPFTVRLGADASHAREDRNIETVYSEPWNTGIDTELKPAAERRDRAGVRPCCLKHHRPAKALDRLNPFEQG
jgi:hypothetical protein